MILILGVTVVSLHAHVVIEGRDADAGEFPFFAAGEGCGGTLIYEDIVLTAAHCTADGAFAFDEFAQIGGKISPWQNDIEDLDGEIIPTVCAVDHPRYKDVGTGFDIALVKLARPSTRPLIELNFDVSVPSIHQKVTAVGNGIYGDGEPISLQTSSPEYVEVLQVLTPIFIQPYPTCRFNSPFFNVDFHLCTNDDDPMTNTCQGEGGGPIITEDGVQVGLLSFGSRDPIGNECFGVRPRQWTNIAKFESFIKMGICGKRSFVTIFFVKCSRVLILAFASSTIAFETALSYSPPNDCPTDTDLSLLRTCLNLPTDAPTSVPINARTKVPKASMKNKRLGRGKGI